MIEIDPLVAVPAEPAVRTDAPGVEQPAPTAEQQQVADGVFSKEQAELAHAALGLQVGLGLLHHLAAETFGGQAREETPPAPPGRQEDDRPR